MMGVHAISSPVWQSSVGTRNTNMPTSGEEEDDEERTPLQ